MDEGWIVACGDKFVKALGPGGDAVVYHERVDAEAALAALREEEPEIARSFRVRRVLVDVDSGQS